MEKVKPVTSLRELRNKARHHSGYAQLAIDAANNLGMGDCHTRGKKGTPADIAVDYLELNLMETIEQFDDECEAEENVLGEVNFVLEGSEGSYDT